MMLDKGQISDQANRAVSSERLFSKSRDAMTAGHRPL
jgi:hypothetical protein